MGSSSDSSEKRNRYSRISRITREVLNMNNVNKTLYIPLYGKSYVSKKGIILHDNKAEEIWEKEGFELKGKSKSKWLAYYMGMRSKVFDMWLAQKMNEIENAIVVHIGCGMDSRVERVGTQGHLWFDVDFPEVIAERKRYFKESEEYHMIASDARKQEWMKELPENVPAIVVMEGISMYLSLEELNSLLIALANHFSKIHLLMDCYTTFAAKASKYKNPINDVGVTEVHGLDEPKLLENSGLKFVKEYEMTPQNLIDELKGIEKSVFEKLYAGSISKKMYRMNEYGKEI
jgi:O-methyltransferase involved in polyketide biosynthesis